MVPVLKAQDYAARVRKVEPCTCPVTIDSAFKTQCGYLIVPENRLKNNGKTIKLPFVVVLSNNPHKSSDPLLFTTGGPGGSSLGWAVGASKHAVIKDRDCIAFEQRGTRYAIPNLWSDELSNAIKEAYRENLDKDSMMLEGTKKYRKALEDRGIDLSGYNTDETVADIDDLLLTLHIDSVNLTGGSYSGGLMLAVLRKDPARVRSLVLDSPLPTFVPIDEDEPANFNEALHILFQYVQKDSADKVLYGNLEARFKAYFTAIGNKKLFLPYLEKGSKDSLHVAYTRNDLLDIIENNMGRPRYVPYIITQIIKGNHSELMKERLDGIFQNNDGPSGMRMSVYCADQTAYHRESVLNQVVNAYPYMAGYHINDVYKAMCNCWQVPPVNKETKQPFYSDKPVLLADGELDNACRPLYIDMIHHYMPNSQRLLYTNGAHMVIGGRDWDTFVRNFLNNPYQAVVTKRSDVIAY
jgi:pimeloyl-ACP methyl ester carboxylesterase